MMPTSGFDVRVVLDWSQVRDEWPGFADFGTVLGFPFQAREWITAWMETLGRSVGEAPLFVVVERADAPVAYLPLAIKRRLGVRSLEFLGGDFADYHAPLIAAEADADETMAEAVWAALRQGPVPFDLLRIERSPELIQGRPNPFLSWRSWTYRMSGHEAALEGSWNRWFEASFGRQSRSNLRRQRRQLESKGPVREAFADDVGEALAWLDRLVRFKSERMAEADQAGANTLASPDVVAFYRRVTELDREQRHVRVYALCVAREPIAIQWGIEAGRRFTNVLTSHAGGEWKRSSPGLHLFKSLFEWCFSQGIRAFDFGIGDEPYKDRWCEARIGLRTLARPRTWRGRVAIAAASARQGLRRSETMRRLWRGTRLPFALRRLDSGHDGPDPLSAKAGG